MQARETYTYGNGRMSYLNNQTGDSYQYLTNQSGSVTGLTKDGQAVASTSYNLYGSTKESNDETGNPFAYNGEARDVTGLDYLRARYYDSQVGTFLTEDSYSGELTDPLSQNLYSYVQNNPVNYTDPSGHRKMGLNVPRRRIINTRNQRKYSQMRVDPALSGHSGIGGGGYLSAANHIRHRVQSNPSYRPPASYYAAFGPHVARYIPPTAYRYNQQQQTQTLVFNPLTALQRAQANGQSTYNWGKSKSKEAGDIHRNWTKALEETQKHVCDPKRMKAGDKAGTSPSKKQLQDILYKANKGDKNALLKLIKGWNHKAGIGTNARTPEEIAAGNKRVVDNLIKGGKDFAGEILSIYDIQRLFTGKDPVTGKDANRGVAGFWLAVDVVTVLLPFTKLGKIGKGAKAADVVDDASDAAKGAKVVDAVEDVKDGAKGLQGSKSLSELPQNVQDAYRGYDGVGWQGNYRGQSPGTRAGGKYNNNEGYLPNFDNSGNKITYREFDINSKVTDSGRDAERFIRGSDGSIYYTDKHYKTFIKVK